MRCRRLPRQLCELNAESIAVDVSKDLILGISEDLLFCTCDDIGPVTIDPV